MADKSTQPVWDPIALAVQLQNVAQQSQTLMQRFVSNQADATKLGMGDTSTLGFDFADLMTRMMTDPATVEGAGRSFQRQLRGLAKYDRAHVQPAGPRG
jgi:polyhydroxyalkanoate synthase subunit PhaC